MTERAAIWPLRTPLLNLSLALHAAGIALIVWRPSLWPFVISVLAADHLLVVAGGLWPRSGLIGPNLRRLPSRWSAQDVVALTFDDGPDPEVTPQLLELLDRRGVKATFFCIGQKAERHPEVVRAIVDAGHQVENHTHHHSNGFWFLGPRSLRREVDRAQSVLGELAGSRPHYFRAPAGIRSPWLDMVLAGRGLQLVSWTRRAFDTVTADADRILARLVRGLAAGDVLLLHDGSSARDASGRPAVLRVLPRLLDHLEQQALRPIALPRPHLKP